MDDKAKMLAQIAKLKQAMGSANSKSSGTPTGSKGKVAGKAKGRGRSNDVGGSGVKGGKSTYAWNKAYVRPVAGSTNKMWKPESTSAPAAAPAATVVRSSTGQSQSVPQM